MTSQLDYEAAAARYGAISEHHERLSRLLADMAAAVEAEWEEARQLLKAHESQPGVHKPFTEGRALSYDDIDDLYELAAERLSEIFPWSVPGFSAHAQAGVEAIKEASK